MHARFRTTLNGGRLRTAAIFLFFENSQTASTPIGYRKPSIPPADNASAVQPVRTALSTVVEELQIAENAPSGNRRQTQQYLGYAYFAVSHSSLLNCEWWPTAWTSQRQRQRHQPIDADENSSGPPHLIYDTICRALCAADPQHIFFRMKDSGMGYKANCPKCAFSMCGGHSHHSGSSAAVCDTCRVFFSCPTDDPWGPGIGELITVCKVKIIGKGRKQKIELLPTALRFEVLASETTCASGRRAVFAQYPPEGLDCPECVKGTVHFGFDVGDNCPWCSKGKLEFESFLY